MELARLHAANGDNLVLVARSIGKMEELKAELEKAYGIQVMVIGKDLSHADAPAQIYFEVKKAGIEIEYLINNAGFGGRGTFAHRHCHRSADDRGRQRLGTDGRAFARY